MKMKLSYKILAGYLVVVILLGIVAYLGINGMKTGEQAFTGLINKRLQMSNELGDLRFLLTNQGYNFRGYMLTKKPEYYQNYQTRGEEFKKVSDTVLSQATTAEGKVTLDRVQKLHDQYEETVGKLKSLQDQGRTAEANQLLTQCSALMDEVQTNVDEFTKLNDKATADGIAAQVADAAGTQRKSLFFSVVAAIMAVIIALYISNSISKPVVQVVDMLKDMAESGGDLTKRIAVKAKDEIGDLAQWFNAFLDNLHEIMAQVKTSAETVTAAANETSMGNQDLSQRTEEQASSLEEISSTIEEVTASLQKSSESSEDADRISRTTLETVRSSEQVVGEMQGAMADITKGSQEIAEIIAKVNDIAFQTNLLALNAAVEAARAGEQGRGFAVVAAEVRNLASRTAESAKEIEGLIKESIQRVDKGNHLMSDVSKVLGDVVTNTEHTTDVIMEIAASMKEQSSAAEDIRTAVDQLNQVTQQNASLVEEIAGSSEAVSNEAEELAALVGKFRLRDQASGLAGHKNQPMPAKRSYSPKGGLNKVGGSVTSSPHLAAAASYESFDEADFEKF